MPCVKKCYATEVEANRAASKAQQVTGDKFIWLVKFCWSCECYHVMRENFNVKIR